MLRIVLGGLVASVVLFQTCWAQVVIPHDRKSEWHGHPRLHFAVRDRQAYVVVPKQPLPGNPWIWRARFPGYHDAMDRELVAAGYHLGYVDVADLFGSAKAIGYGAAFYEYVVEHGLSKTPVMEGVSRGGLFVYNWAAKFPDRVAGIYCDTPVCDFKSWPGGRGKGRGSNAAWSACCRAYGLTEPEALRYPGNPVDVDQVTAIAKARIPILHIVSENDNVVPPAENTYLLQRKLRERGHSMEIISVPRGTQKSHGHHFEHPEPKRVVDFVMNLRKEDRHEVDDVPYADRLHLLRNSTRIVFLGDSITFGGGYVAHFEAWLNTLGWESPPTVINVGLPSETVSGLSEDGHAGGRFPRPDLAERIERVLKLTKPDLVFACYGINCGIYQPFDEYRFRAYQKGIKQLKERVTKRGAQLIVITPPSFDDRRAKRDFSYNQVLDRYTEWLVKEFSEDEVIDLHTAMTNDLESRRKEDPEFTFQPDSVHPNEAGHRFIAGELMGWFAGAKARPASAELVAVTAKRMRLLRDSYVYTAGHKRPGVKRGLPPAWALEQSKVLSAEIERLSH